MIVVILNRRDDGWVADIDGGPYEEEHRYDLRVEDVIKLVNEVESAAIKDTVKPKRKCSRCGVELDSNEDLFCTDCVLLTSDEELWK